MSDSDRNRLVLYCEDCDSAWCLPPETPERQAWAQLIRSGAKHPHKTVLSDVPLTSRRYCIARLLLPDDAT